MGTIEEEKICNLPILPGPSLQDCLLFLEREKQKVTQWTESVRHTYSVLKISSWRGARPFLPPASSNAGGQTFLFSKKIRRI